MSGRAPALPVVIDANVLAGALTRNIILSLAEAGFFQPYWSSRILDEFERYCARKTNSADTAKRQRTRMVAAFPEAMVGRFEKIEAKLQLPDPEDRHVLAAAIKAEARVILTENVKDFPAQILRPYDMYAVTMDVFVSDLLSLAEAKGIAALKTMRERFNKPDIDAECLILKIEGPGMTKTAKILTACKGLL